MTGEDGRLISFVGIALPLFFVLLPLLERVRDRGFDGDLDLEDLRLADDGLVYH